MVDPHGFDPVARIYDWFPSGTHAKHIRRALKGTQGPLIDIGGGTGKYTTRFTPPNARPIIADVSRAMMQRAQKRRPHIGLIQSLGHRLPIQDNSIAAVTCTEAFHHFGHHQEAIITEIARILQPQGTLIIEDMDPHSHIGRLATRMHSHEKVTGQGHSHEPLRFHDPASMHALVSPHFQDVTTKKSGWSTYLTTARHPNP